VNLQKSMCLDYNSIKVQRFLSHEFYIVTELMYMHWLELLYCYYLRIFKVLLVFLEEHLFFHGAHEIQYGVLHQGAVFL